MKQSSPFDEVIDRFKTSSFKYQFCDKLFGTKELIPMWVADMDYRSPACVTDALAEYLKEGIYGYSLKSSSYFKSIIAWQKNQHEWEIKEEWIASAAGTVSGFNCAVLALSDPGDKILIQTPVYFPFYDAATDHGRVLLKNSLKYVNGLYEIDWDDFEAKLKQGVKIFLLCSPHNPVGRVWTQEELLKMGELCCKYGTVIFSDEIHSDLVHNANKHLPIAKLSRKISLNTVTFNSPTKTFNIAGAAPAYVICENFKYLVKYKKIIQGLHLFLGTSFGDVALEAAYTGGRAWLEELLIYLKNNIDLVREFCLKSDGKIKLVEPEATYLLWLDCKGLGLTHSQLQKVFVETAKLGLSEGMQFGMEGEGFMRMNIACPRSVFKKALKQMEHLL